MQADLWFRPLVWLDYRLAVLLTVFLPLTLLVWSLLRRRSTLVHLLVIYWRVASLLFFSVYLLIPAWSIGFATGFLARLLIPVSLWFWVDLNEEIADLPPRPLKLAFTGWRWAASLYCALGTLASLPTLSCVLNAAPAANFCRVWLEPVWAYKQWLHPNADPGFLGAIGAIGLCVYGLYFIYFLVMRLSRQGRAAITQH
ncbi:MAG: DUF3177 family protein [Spirulinaceae cyanobacterium SM2_1_0]|nr:DUF3177 family protein [Spirulinaceae cyanobacterium SM2_1_0]